MTADGNGCVTSNVDRIDDCNPTSADNVKEVNEIVLKWLNESKEIYEKAGPF